MQGISLLVIGVLCLSHLAFGTEASAQTPTPLVEADDLGLWLPSSVKAIPGHGRRVVVPRDDASEADEPPVGKVHLEVGDWLVVNMPNGGLRSVPRSNTTATDRPFVAATKKSMSEALAAQFVGFKQRATKHYLFIYNTSEPFYEATSRILETMHPKLVAYCRRHKLSTQSIDTPLVVIMFKTEAEFRKYRQMRGSILAYYNSVSNRIILYEQSALAQVAPTIAVKQSISTIAHEGVHQILHNIGVQQRLASWPMWISEGLPEYFAPTSVARRAKWKGVGFPNDLRMRELIRHFEGMKLPTELEQRMETLILTNEIEHIRPTNDQIGKAFRVDDAEGRYVEFVKRSLPRDMDFQGFRVVLDCANGAAYHVFPKVLKELGANVWVMGDTPDGTNINADCGAVHPQQLQRAVREHHADVGIALDGDADRAVFICEEGHLVDGDNALAALALDLSQRGLLRRNTVVGTVMSNFGFE